MAHDPACIDQEARAQGNVLPPPQLAAIHGSRLLGIQEGRVRCA